MKRFYKVGEIITGDKKNEMQTIFTSAAAGKLELTIYSDTINPEAIQRSALRLEFTPVNNVLITTIHFLDYAAAADEPAPIIRTAYTPGIITAQGIAAAADEIEVTILLVSAETQQLRALRYYNLERGEVTAFSVYEMHARRPGNGEAEALAKLLKLPDEYINRHKILI